LPIGQNPPAGQQQNAGPAYGKLPTEAACVENSIRDKIRRAPHFVVSQPIIYLDHETKKQVYFRQIRFFR
jgi:hypothetical protein